MSVVEVKGLSKQFGSVQALDAVSLSVNEGEIFGFLGPNGAGKSTTIRCIMDFIRPSAGRITVFGKDAHAASVELKRDIGYVPAEPTLYDDWTVGEHVDFIAGMRGSSKAGANRLLHDLELSASRKVRHLSTGNQQKLAIILGLIGDPKLLILDEPTRGLDPLLQSTFHDIVKDYQKQGGTVFLSSHNLPEVDELCTRVAVIRAGKLITETSIDDLKEKSTHTVSVSFSGNVPDLKKLGVQELTTTDHTIHFKISGDINPLLQALAKQKVKDIEINRATLEEIFMELYQS